MIYLLVLILLLLVLPGGLWLRRRRYRAMLLASALTPREWDILLDAVPALRNLPDRFREPLEGKIALFIDQVDFVGCDGFEVTEEVELSIAAQASLLLVNRDLWYDHLSTVLVYPGAFRSKTQRSDGFVVTEQEQVRLGESWSQGPVVLSWQHSEAGAQNPKDGHNVVLHEFAHQLDDLSGATDAVPVLARGQSFDAWRAAIVDAFETHVRKTQSGRGSVLDAYAATAPEEFFAVAVEVFFEKPGALRSELPAVYEQLSLLFRLDPHTWDAR